MEKIRDNVAKEQQCFKGIRKNKEGLSRSDGLDYASQDHRTSARSVVSREGMRDTNFSKTSATEQEQRNLM